MKILSKYFNKYTNNLKSFYAKLSNWVFFKGGYRTDASLGLHATAHHIKETPIVRGIRALFGDSTSWEPNNLTRLVPLKLSELLAESEGVDQPVALYALHLITRHLLQPIIFSFAALTAASVLSPVLTAKAGALFSWALTAATLGFIASNYSIIDQKFDTTKKLKEICNELLEDFNEKRASKKQSSRTDYTGSYSAGDRSKQSNTSNGQTKQNGFYNSFKNTSQNDGNSTPKKRSRTTPAAFRPDKLRM
jgi:hypothetical protein